MSIWRDAMGKIFVLTLDASLTSYCMLDVLGGQAFLHKICNKITILTTPLLPPLTSCQMVIWRQSCRCCTSALLQVSA